MKKLLLSAFAALALAALISLPSAAIDQAEAATPNVTPGAGQVVVIPIQISGQYTATTAKVARFTLPFPAELLGVSAAARVSGGTSPTLTVDLKAGGDSVLSSAISVTGAAKAAEGTIETSDIDDEEDMTVDLTIGGTNPTWDDITVLITVFRK